MNLLKYLGKRLLTIIFSIIIIIIITYLLMYAAPGNFFDIQRFQTGGKSGLSGSSVTQEQIEILRKGFEERYGLNQPLWKQILTYFVNAVQFKFGPSFYNPSMKIEELIAQKFPVTLGLGLLSIGLAILLGIPLGIISALRRNTWVDYTTSFISMLGQAIPAYVLGIFLIMLFSVTFRIFPTSGWAGPKYMILPVITLAVGPMAVIARFTRTSLLDTLGQDYIRTAYAKGGNNLRVISKHGLRNSMIPIVTIVGPNLANILAGSAIYIEKQFRIPGIGLLFTDALGWRDYPLIITNTFLLALFIMFMNLIVDIVYALLDPRIRLE